MTDIRTKVVKNDNGSYNVENLNWYEVQRMVEIFPFMKPVLLAYKSAQKPKLPTRVGSVVEVDFARYFRTKRGWVGPSGSFYDDSYIGNDWKDVTPGAEHVPGN